MSDALVLVLSMNARPNCKIFFCYNGYNVCYKWFNSVINEIIVTTLHSIDPFGINYSLTVAASTLKWHPDLPPAYPLSVGPSYNGCKTGRNTDINCIMEKIMCIMVSDMPHKLLPSIVVRQSVASNQTPNILVGCLSFPAVQIKDCCLFMQINWVQIFCYNGYNGML